MNSLYSRRCDWGACAQRLVWSHNPSLLSVFSVESEPLYKKVISVVNSKRPVNLDIGTIKLPITSYVSILHRLSGVVLFLAVALLLWVFEASLESQQSFQSLKEYFANPICQVLLWGSLVALAYHVVAGIRHLIMDFGIGEDSFESGRCSAWIVVAVVAIAVVIISWWVFL